MSATMSPPVTVDTPSETAVQAPRPAAATAHLRAEPAVPASPTSPVRNGLFFATWAPALVVAGAAAAVVLVLGAPIGMALAWYEGRRYR